MHQTEGPGSPSRGFANYKARTRGGQAVSFPAQRRLAEESHRRLERHLLQRRRVVVYPDPVEGSVHALEGHVVRDEAEVSLVHVDTVHVKHSRDLSDDGLVCSFDPVVFCHVVDIVARKLLNIEDFIEVKYVVNIDPVSFKNLLSLLLEDECTLNVLDLVHDGLGGGQPQHLADVHPLLGDVEGECDARKYF